MIIDSPIISGSYSASGSLNQFGNVVISGSLTVTGSIIGTASFASTASYLSGYVSPFPFTGSAIISGSLAVTGSLFVTGSQTFIGTKTITGSVFISGSKTVIGTNTVTGSMLISGSLDVNGPITATTLIVQTITASQEYSSGSNVFGNSLANTQILTGSVSITGSLAVNGSNAVLTNQTSSMSASYAANATSASSAISSSFANTAGSLVTTSNYQMASLGVGTAPVAPFKGNFYGQVIVQNGINNATGQQSLIFAYPGITNNLTHSIWSGHDASVANYNKLDFYIGKTSGLAAVNVLSLRSSQPVLIGSDTGLGLTVSGSTVISGSLTSTTGITGSLLGTSSFANNATSASYALTASFSLNVPVTASYANNATSASFATTASYLSGYVSPFPFTGSAIISGSLTVTGSLNASGSGTMFALNADVLEVTGSIIATSGFTGSLFGTASYWSGSITNALSSSFATTASYWSGSINNVNSASFATSASQALTASYLSGYVSPFPFTGSAIISGSLGVTGSFKVTNLSGSGVRYLVADESGSITAQSASAALKSTQAFTSTAGQTTFSVTNGYSTGYVDVFINGSKLSTAEFTDTSGTNIVLATGSFVNDTVEVVKYTPAAGVTNNVLRQLTTFTGSAGQTVFSASYTPGLLDIFYNGSRLSPSDFTANNGTFFTLATGSAANDILDVLVYSYQVGAFSGIGGVGTAGQVAYFGTTSSITGSPNFTISGSTMTVTGSLIVSGSGTFTNIGPAVFSGSLTSTAGFTGSFSGTATSASYASNADLLDGLDSTVFTLTSSFAAQTASFTAFTSSVNSFTASQLVLNGTYATTGSNTFKNPQTINSNLTVTGSITAQTLIVSTINATQSYSSGSNIFGNASSNTQTFTGSVNITGSVAIASAATYALDVTGGGRITSNILVGNTGSASSVWNRTLQVYDSNSSALSVRTGVADWHIGTNSSGNLFHYNNTNSTHALTISGSGYVGIGTTTPNYANLVILNAAVNSGNNSALTIGRATSLPSSAADYGNIFLFSTDGYAADKGGTISFGSQYGSSGGETRMSGIFGGKENATNGDYSGYLSFYTRLSGNQPTERMRITSGGELLLNTTTTYWGATGRGTFEMNGSTDCMFAQKVGNVNQAYMYASATQTEIYSLNKLRLSGGNILINTTTDYGYKLSIIGTNNLYILGGTTTSSGNTIVIQNSATTELFKVRNDGLIYTGTAALSPYNYGGGSSILYVGSAGQIGVGSSTRESKTNIQYLNDVSWLLSLKPASFNKWKRDEENNFTDQYDPITNYGLIADEVEEVKSDFVFYDKDNKLAGVHYDRLIAPILKLVQEQQTLITALQEKLERNNIN